MLGMEYFCLFIYNEMKLLFCHLIEKMEALNVWVIEKKSELTGLTCQTWDPCHENLITQ